mmetsp:Transcript_69340/g.201111  ORF Transcript_69340/g.201111 Transcript_69340/m.201111 type:complete len:328 (+) Transcript_69340:359-1342(+)
MRVRRPLDPREIVDRCTGQRVAARSRAPHWPWRRAPQCGKPCPIFPTWRCQLHVLLVPLLLHKLVLLLLHDLRLQHQCMPSRLSLLGALLSWRLRRGRRLRHRNGWRGRRRRRRRRRRRPSCRLISDPKALRSQHLPVSRRRGPIVHGARPAVAAVCTGWPPVGGNAAGAAHGVAVAEGGPAAPRRRRGHQGPADAEEHAPGPRTRRPDFLLLEFCIPRQGNAGVEVEARWTIRSLLQQHDQDLVHTLHELLQGQIVGPLAEWPLNLQRQIVDAPKHKHVDERRARGSVPCAHGVRASNWRSDGIEEQEEAEHLSVMERELKQADLA